ncbi:MAG: hypothetical protein QOI74_1034 [Micromonosporaceae bacterium]|nr:hypothetical protein [Micromonosporaceae bacterium]
MSVAEVVAADPTPRPVPGRGRRHAVALGVISTVAATIYAACSFNRYLMLRAGTYDLVIFDQAVRSYSRGHLPVAIVKGVHNGFGPGFSVLGDHFSPILVLLAPLYWVYDGPQTLLVAQAMLFAAAIGPLWILVRRELGTVAAYCVVGAYAVSWPIVAAVDFDFHEVAFAPLIMAVLFERLSAYRHGTGRWWHLALPCAALVLVKEDLGLLVATLGLCLSGGALGAGPPRWRGSRALGGGPPGRRGSRTLGGEPPGWRGTPLLGAALLVGGVAVTVVEARMLIPAFGGRADYYWTYSRLGPDVPSALGHVVAHPLDTLATFTRPAVKVRTMLALLALSGGMALLSPYLLVVMPLLAERMLSDAPNWWITGVQYNAYLVVPLLYAGVDGAVRLRSWWRRRGRASPARIGTAWAVVVLVIGLIGTPLTALGALPYASSWRPGPDLRAAAGAAGSVPSGVLVEAVSPIGPRLSARTRVLLWDRTPRYANWVVADVRRRQFPFCSLDEQRRRVDLLTSRGYRVVFDRRGYVVLHNEAAVAQLSAPSAPRCP